MTNNPRLLLVDDDALIRKTLGTMLRRDFDVTTAADGREAYDLIRDRDFDVILSDFYLPGMTGKDLHGALSRDRPEMAARMVFMSGNVDDPRVRSFVDGLRHLQKTAGRDVLRGLLMDAVNENGPVP